MAEFLVVPALLAYGEAAVAYAGELRGPGLAGRLATWGVRLGWLAQTALLAGPGGVGGGVSVGNLGRLAQPVRLARRRRLSDLGLHPSLPAARPHRDAGRGSAARARLGRRRDGTGRERAFRCRAGDSRRADARRLRRPDARRGDGCALPLAGAEAEAPRAGCAPRARAAARRARPARGPERARFHRPPDARDRRRRGSLPAW